MDKKGAFRPLMVAYGPLSNRHMGAASKGLWMFKLTIRMLTPRPFGYCAIFSPYVRLHVTGYPPQWHAEFH